MHGLVLCHARPRIALTRHQDRHQMLDVAPGQPECLDFREFACLRLGRNELPQRHKCRINTAKSHHIRTHGECDSLRMRREYLWVRQRSRAFACCRVTGSAACILKSPLDANPSCGRSRINGNSFALALKSIFG